jgi:YggT family protein
MEFALAFVRVFDVVLSILQWTVVIWVIISWILFFTHSSKFRWRHRAFYNLIEQLNDIFERMTRPFLRPIRRWLRRYNTAGIDWSPLILLLAIFLVRELMWAAVREFILRPRTM